jgi:diacylglycerol kinase family enzyme
MAPVTDRDTDLRVLVLVNAGAGTARHQSDEVLRAGLAAAFERAAVAAEFAFVPSRELGAAAEQARERAALGEIDAVVVGGGDGSVRTVAAVLAGTGVPLGILPLGTLNHFAKDLGIPVSLDAAVRVVAARQTRAVDVAEVNGQVFINNSSIGIYPYMVLDRERRREKHGLAKWTAMALAVVRTIRYFPRRRLSISAEGWTEPYRTPCLFVGNNQYRLAGRSLGRRETLDRGELCLYVAKHETPLGLAWLALRSALGLIDESRDLRTARASSAEITSRASRLLMALDGEATIVRPPLRYRTRPRALRVFAPSAA